MSDKAYLAALEKVSDLKQQRDQLREALERLLYEGSQTSESKFIANRVKARAALEAGGDA